MANFKRNRPRNRTYGGSKSRGHWLRHWPAWWDRIFNIRPARRASHALEHALERDAVDPDEAVPSHDGRKPHHYYW